MRNVFTMITAIALAVCMGGVAFAEKAPQSVYDLAASTLADVGHDPVIVKAVRVDNAKVETLADIKAMDAKWKATAGIADYMKAMMDNECGKYISRIQKKYPYMDEIFVMDNQGANVCMTDKTSDYWQGDEAKFKNSFNGGKGAVFVDDVEFDDSTQAYTSQVSVPVVDGGKVIGAITFGIDIDNFK